MDNALLIKKKSEVIGWGFTLKHSQGLQVSFTNLSFKWMDVHKHYNGFTFMFQ